jgi:competence protein ComGC
MDLNDDDKTKEIPDIEKLVSERVAQQLKDIKEKLDKAYTARDEAQKEAANIKKEKETFELEKLKSEGKVKEALEKEIASLQADNAALNDQVTKLTRDNELSTVLSTYEFRSDSARKMTITAIKRELVKDESGVWKHSSGTSIEEYCKSFFEAADNEFLLKPKENSGGGFNKVNKGITQAKSLKDLSQTEVLKLIADGKLSRKNRR